MAKLLEALPEELRLFYQPGKELFRDKNKKCKFWNGCGFFPGFEPDTIRYAMEHHEPNKDEILVVSCPKTGTTWVREIVRQLLYSDDKKLDLITRDLDPAMIYLETGNSKKYNILHNMPIPRTYYATHLGAELINVEKYRSKNMKFIYTLRNPKDRLVSLFHFLQNFPWYAGMMPGDPNNWADFFDVQSKGQFPMCGKMGEGQMEHILGWLPYIQNNENAMIMVYEEMIRDPKTGVRKISDLLGLIKTEKEIIKISENTSMKVIKKIDETSTSAESTVHKSVGLLRKGEIGDWKNYFSPEQSAFIDDEVEKKLKGTGITFIYE